MVSNSLFNQPLMNKYIKKYDKQFEAKYTQKEAVIKWIKKLNNGDLKDEVANYGRFSRMILEDILGYDYEENIEENVKEDYGRGLSEFALKKKNKKFMVIELKGSDADLDKAQNRVNDKRTPVDQAFDYAKRSGDIDWIFVSNYKEFRLYNWHKKQHNYISFMAEDLVDPENFKSFMLVFSKFSTVDHNLIEKLVSKTIFVERDLEAEFYKLYNETRLMLIAELEYLHPEFTREKSVHYAQLILNRYIFICFAEDLGLLPEEISVETIETTVNNHRLRGSEIWHDLNGLFFDVDKGNEKIEDNEDKIIYGYNGGLFEEDIEFLKIRDIVTDQSIFKDAYQKWKFEEYSLLVEEKVSPYSGKINPIYKNFMTISSFNFSSELDVNILGHIFENSIGDIEELKADEKGRRKKDGIFYTPEYITDYICRNTIIPYLSKSGKATNVEKLVREYWGSEIKQLDEKVRNIKIVDPACGSGAFLNKASDVLLEIHEKIHEIEYKDDPTLNPYFDDVKERRKILLNNIYGVDLNEESVEITKLALFLKICKEGLKLPNLDKNIKCGNSIVDDPEYVGEKAFNWEMEFPEIFKEGGFDIVIGNPPYVRQERIKEIKPYLKKNYETYTGVADLYVYFFEKGINILKENGMFSFICSNAFTKSNYGKQLRNFILKYKFSKYMDYSQLNVFTDAKVDPCVIVIKKTKPEDISKILINENYEIQQNRLTKLNWSFERPEIIELKEKIENKGIKLKKINDLNIYRGILTGFNEAFIIDEKKKNELVKEDPKSLDIIKPIISGKEVQKWEINSQDHYLLYIPWHFPLNERSDISGPSKEAEIEFKQQYKAIYDYLIPHKERLLKRNKEEVGKRYEWYALQRFASDYYQEFEKPKLIYPEIKSSLFAVYDENKFFINKTCFMITSESINLKYLSALISSKLLNFVFKLIGTPIAKTSARSNEKIRFNLSKISIEKLPIYIGTPEDQDPLIIRVDSILQLKKELREEINSFHDWLQRTFQIEKLSQKLEKYYELDFEDFLMEIKKKKVDIKTRKTQELLESEFNQSIAIINPLLQQIKETDREIDDLVYDLYGLTSEEREIIEESLK